MATFDEVKLHKQSPGDIMTVLEQGFGYFPVGVDNPQPMLFCF